MLSAGKKIIVFSGSSNLPLTQSICVQLDLVLGNASVSTYSDGEICVNVMETVRGADVFVVQSTCYPVNDHLMELLIMADACRRASAGRITAVIPYFGYARQDRKAKPRDPISAKLVANLIVKAGVDRLLTLDLHTTQLQGFFDIPVDHLLGCRIFTQYFAKKIGKDVHNWIAVSPDVGSVRRTRDFSHRIGGIPMAIVDKRRETANVSEVMNIIGDVRGKKCIIVDDLVDTAGTLVGAARALMDIGGATEVYACASHAVLSGKAYERIDNSVLRQLVVLDTIPLKSKSDKLVVLPTAPLFAEGMERIHLESSISALFD